MTFLDTSRREINCKIVYVGPGLAGKTTNLQFLFDAIPSNCKGKLRSVATETERTLFFDCVFPKPLVVQGYRLRFHLYTVPG